MPELACPPLSRDAIAAVIDGRGAAERVPILLRFLFTAGNGLTPDTPLPSLEALFEEAFAYGRE